jgi:siroheme synthase-like protein
MTLPEPPSDPPDDPTVPDYPVLLHLAGWPCLVVGGGPVAARRAAGLADAGGVVTVVAPRTVAAIDAEESAGRLSVHRRPYRPGEAVAYRLVLTATGDPAVDAAVVAEATAAGTLVATADQITPGTVGLPSVLRHGPVTVAVSTGGTSPALARWVRSRIVGMLPADLAVLADLLSEGRRRLQEAGRPTGSVDWDDLLDRRLVPLVAAGRVDDARAVVQELGGGPGGSGDGAPAGDGGGPAGPAAGRTPGAGLGRVVP